MDTRIVTSFDIQSDIVDRARAPLPSVASLAVDIDRERRLPSSLLDTLHEARLFRLLLPRSQGALETDPVTFFRVIEAIATADASTAWCLSQAGGCAMAAAYLDPAVAHRVVGDPRAVLTWGPGPKAKGGYRVTGVSAFATWARPVYRSLLPDGWPELDRSVIDTAGASSLPDGRASPASNAATTSFSWTSR